MAPTVRVALAVIAAVLFIFAGLTLVIGVERDLPELVVGFGWFSFGMAATVLLLAVPRGAER